MNARVFQHCSVSCKMQWNRFEFLIILIFLSGSVFSARFKRTLVFNKGSRLFVRLNLRQDLFKSTPTFIQGLGFKMSWDLPDTVRSTSKMQRRDLFHGIETLLTQHRINGKMCMKRFLCESEFVLKHNNDFVSRLLMLIFQSEKSLQNKLGTSCEEEMTDCPLSLLSFLH